MSWEPRFHPRQWQTEALQAWESAGRRGIAAVVTGAGKTAFAEMCMVSAAGVIDEPRYIVIVPTLALLDQWFVALNEDLGVAQAEIAVQAKRASAASVYLYVVNTARTYAPKLADPRRSVLVVDECHRVGAPINALALTGDHAASLGISATPERQYDQGLEAYVIPALGSIIYRYDYASARRDGVIAAYELVNVRVQLLPNEQREYGRSTQAVRSLMRRLQNGEAVEDSLTRALRARAALSATAVMRVPAAVRLVESRPGIRAVVFHERIKAAERIAGLLTERGRRAALYHSGIVGPVRRDNLALFRRGVYDCLVTCRALDEGVNVPDAALGVIASSTASLRQRIQRMGRVLRPAPGKSHAVVCTIYATDVEEERLVREAAAGSGADSVTWIEMEVGGNARARD